MDNTTNITTLPASRELDRMIAEKVMGWKEFHYSEFNVTRLMPPHPIGDKLFDYRNCPLDNLWPNYSTNIGDAWLVLEKMIAKIHEDDEEFFDFQAPEYQRTTKLWRIFYHVDKFSLVYNFVECDSASLAICRAALAVVQLEERLKENGKEHSITNDKS